MSFLVFDYMCKQCRLQFPDTFVRASEKDLEKCPKCEELLTRKCPAPNLDWDALAMGESASPEAVRHFEQKRKKQAAHEAKIIKEHGSLK